MNGSVNSEEREARGEERGAKSVWVYVLLSRRSLNISSPSPLAPRFTLLDFYLFQQLPAPPCLGDGAGFGVAGAGFIRREEGGQPDADLGGEVLGTDGIGLGQGGRETVDGG